MHTHTHTFIEGKKVHWWNWKKDTTNWQHMKEIEFETSKPIFFSSQFLFLLTVKLILQTTIHIRCVGDLTQIRNVGSRGCVTNTSRRSAPSLRRTSEHRRRKDELAGVLRCTRLLTARRCRGRWPLRVLLLVRTEKLLLLQQIEQLGCDWPVHFLFKTTLPPNESVGSVFNQSRLTNNKSCTGRKIGVGGESPSRRLLTICQTSRRLPFRNQTQPDQPKQVDKCHTIKVN